MEKEKDLKTMYKAMAALGVAINLLNDLEGTAFNRGRLKQKINMALRAMEEHEAYFCNKQGIKDNQLEEKKVWEQLQDSYTYFESWLDTLFDIPESRHEKFNNYVQLGLKMYSDVDKA